MRRIGKMRRKKQKKIIIVSALSLLLFLTIGYAAFNTNLSITAKGNIKDKSRVIQAWSGTDQTDFHSDYYKENIVSATFLDNTNVPSNATESWNVSDDETHGGVMAWVVPNNEDSTKYDLYIGAKNGVVANENSSCLFYRFTRLTTIVFGNTFDTSRVTSMNQMFNGCQSLQEIQGLENFNTRYVTDMYAMFHGCSSLKELNLINFNTNNLIRMDLMFYSCRTLQKLDLSSFNTSSVRNLSWVFAECNNLETLNLSNFDTKMVTDMNSMFKNCQKLHELDLCSFNTSNTTSMWEMFYGAKSLLKVKVGPNWTTENANTSNMFSNSGVSSVTTGQC